MKKVLIFGALLALVCIGFAGVAKADTTSAGGVTYTFTSGGSDGSGGFLVIMTVDTTGATADGTLSSFAIQFTGATNVSFTTSANAGTWDTMIQGNNGGNSCTLNVNTNFWCSNSTSGGIGITAAPGDGDVYTFTFDVTGVNPTSTHIQTMQGEGALAISNDAGIGPPTQTPEPASMLLLGLGLAGAPFLRRRRS
jgi:hypothetical protein